MLSRLTSILFASILACSSVFAESVFFEWLPSEQGEMNGYNIYRSEQAGTGYTLLNPSPLDSDFVDSTISPATTYYYVVTGVDSQGTETTFSNEISLTPDESARFGSNDQLDQLSQQKALNLAVLTSSSEAEPQSVHLAMTNTLLDPALATTTDLAAVAARNISAPDGPALLDPDAPGPDHAFTAALVAMNVASIVDLASTYSALDRGGVEANPALAPFSGNKGSLAAVKLGMTSGTSYLLTKVHQRNRKAAFWMAIAATAAFSMAAIHNAGVGR